MRACPSCGEGNPVQARFCSRCGDALGSYCDHCGAEMSASARFCSSCGKPATVESIQATEVLKIVTVLFLDVVGSTERAEKMHPEDTRALMTDFFGAMTEEIEREGGTVERLMGDGIMADFGWPVAHEDDPERAVRAALAMLTRLSKWNVDKDPAHQIQIRIGINTGEVSASGEVSAPGAPGQGLLVTGDPVNVAARLEQSAKPGTVLIGSRTARAVRRSFELRELAPLTLKGKREAVPCFQVERALPETQDPLAFEAALVGRDVELGTLTDIFRRTGLTQSPHLVTVLGDAGVGKSRVIRELVARIEDQARILAGRCIPYGDGVTLWPLREILEGLSGAASAHSPRNALESIEGLVRESIPAEISDSHRTAAALGSTMGLESEVMSALAPRDRHREVLGAWRCLLTQLAREQSLVVVVQDIHWADELTLDVVHDLVTHVEGPVFFVVAARPELFKQRPGWGAGLRNSMTMRLDPLSAEASSELVEGLLNSDKSPVEVRQLVLARCEGNPFFVEEVLRQLIDLGLLRQADSEWVADPGLAQVELPDNIYGVLSARLDLLTPQERLVAQRAAVIGRTFWQGALENLGDGADLTETLRELERRNFISERPRSSIPGEIEFAFTHVLIKDVACQTMPRRLRAATHQGVAAWIERSKGARAAELAELLAHHYSEAHAIAGTDELRRMARSHTLTAATGALKRFGVRQASAFGRRAIELSEGPLERLEALELFADTSMTAFAIDDAWSAYVEALEEARTLGDASAVARLAAQGAIAATRYEGAMKTLPSGRQVQGIIDLGLDSAPEDDLRSRALLFASRAFGAGVGYYEQEAGGRAAAEESLRLAEQLQDAELLSVALDALTFWMAPEARYGQLHRLQLRRVELVPRLADTAEICDCFGSASWASYLVGRYEDSARLATESLTRAEGTEAGNYEHALQWRAIARFTLGDWDGALEDQARLEAIIEDDPASPIPVLLGGAFAYSLLCHELRGSSAESERYLARLESLRRDVGDEMRLPRAAVARALIHRGDLAAAREWLTVEVDYSQGLVLEATCVLAAAEAEWGAAELLADLATGDAERMESPNLLAHVARLRGEIALARGELDKAAVHFEDSATGFEALKNVWEGAMATLLLGKTLHAAGRGTEAELHLARASEIFERLGSVTEAKAAVTALAAL
jgi:class 3 adenylate cyclase/tetratricopeptide (TPR) repeat protein